MKQFTLFIIVIVVATLLASATAALAAGSSDTLSFRSAVEGMMIGMTFCAFLLLVLTIMNGGHKSRFNQALIFLVLSGTALIIMAVTTGCAAKQLPPPKETLTAVTALPKDCDPKRVDPLEKNKEIKEKELAAANKRLDSETARVNTENGRLQEEINTQQKELNSLVNGRPAQQIDKNTFEVLNKKDIEDHAIKEKKANYGISIKEAQIAANRVLIRNLIAQRDLIVLEVEKLTKQLQDELDCLSSRLGQKKLDMNNVAGDASKAPPVVVDEPPPDGK